MFIVVRAVEDTNLTTQFGLLLLHLSGGSSLGSVLIGTLGAAIGTNLVNNVPMAVVLTSSLRGVQHIAPSTQPGFIAATIFGCDLGPNLTTVGSLATILWLLILRRRNLEVSGHERFSPFHGRHWQTLQLDKACYNSSEINLVDTKIAEASGTPCL